MSRSGATLSFTKGHHGYIAFQNIAKSPPIQFRISNALTFRGSAAPLVCPQNLLLKPRTEYTLSLHLLHNDDLFDCTGLHGMVSKLGQGVDARFRVPNGVSVVRSGTVVCQIANFTNKPAFLAKNSLIASFLPIWVVDNDTLQYLRTDGDVVIDSFASLSIQPDNRTAFPPHSLSKPTACASVSSSSSSSTAYVHRLLDYA